MVHLLFQSGKVHQRPGLGIHIIVVDRIWEVAQDGLGAVFFRQDILQTQGEGALEDLTRLSGRNRGIRSRDSAQTGGGQGIPGEAGHLVV